MADAGHGGGDSGDRRANQRPGPSLAEVQTLLSQLGEELGQWRGLAPEVEQGGIKAQMDAVGLLLDFTRLLSAGGLLLHAGEPTPGQQVAFEGTLFAPDGTAVRAIAGWTFMPRSTGSPPELFVLRSDDVGAMEFSARHSNEDLEAAPPGTAAVARIVHASTERYGRLDLPLRDSQLEDASAVIACIGQAIGDALRRSAGD